MFDKTLSIESRADVVEKLRDYIVTDMQFQSVPNPQKSLYNIIQKISMNDVLN